MPAMAPPSAKVNTTTLLTSTPIIAAASVSSETARIAVPMAERPVGDALGQDGDRRRGDDGEGENAGHGEDRAAVEEARAVEGRGQEITGEGARHRDVAVGEIDEAQDAVDHGVAERDQRVDAADREAEHDEVEPLRSRISALEQCADGAADDDDDDGQAQRPEDDVDKSEARERAQLR